MKAPIAQEKYGWVHALNNEGNSLSGIGRLLQVSVSSVQRIIERLAAKLTKPIYNETGECYEMDELCTYCGNKRNKIWLIYAINRKSRKVVDFCVGTRNKENLAKVLKNLSPLKPKHIYTDKLNLYDSLIPKAVHRFYARCTNRIERMNLTLRTRLKHLGRKTTCFSRSERMLGNCIKLLVCYQY